MKKVALIVGLLLMGVMVYAAGTPGGGGEGLQLKAMTGECDSDCDGVPDLLQTRDRTQDRLGRDSAAAGVSANAASVDNGDRDRLQDGSCDGEPIQDRTQLGRVE